MCVCLILSISFKIDAEQELLTTMFSTPLLAQWLPQHPLSGTLKQPFFTFSQIANNSSCTAMASTAQTTLRGQAFQVTSRAQLMQEAREEGGVASGISARPVHLLPLTNDLSNKCNHDCNSEFGYEGGQGVNRSKMAVA